MDPIYTIKKPILTEKSTDAMNDLNQYTFLVDRRASKDDVKAAIEKLYNVKVDRVTTQVRKGKLRRMRYGWVHEKVSKKATVRLQEGDRIELF